MRKVLALVAAMVTGVVLLWGAPASASWDSCPNNRFCAYIDVNGGGAQYYWGPEYYGLCQNIGAPFQDQISSVTSTYTGANWKVTVYMDAGCSGRQLTCDLYNCYILRGERFNMTTTLQDTASSFRVWS